MSINLVKVDTHGNKIALYKKTDKKNIFYIKESMEINSNKIIEREYQGYKWFFNNILKRIPILRTIYSAIGQMTETFTKTEKDKKPKSHRFWGSFLHISSFSRPIFEFFIFLCL